MGRRGENIRKRKDGRWEGRYSKGKRDGKYLQGSVFGKSYKETKEKLIKAKAEYANSRKSEKNKAFNSKEKTLFNEVADNWFDYAKPTLKASSQAHYRNILDNHILSSFAGQEISCISRDNVVSFIRFQLEHGGAKSQGLSPKTVSDILSVLKMIMKYAKNIKMIEVIDCSGISVKQVQKQFRIFTMKEQLAINSYLMTDINYIKLGILIVLFTGLRIGEICALKWGDISIDERKLHVGKTMQRIQLPKGNIPRTKVIIDVPKSVCSIRDIPIPSDIFKVLLQYRLADDCYILTGSETTYMEPRSLENHFDAIMIDCDIEKATMHTCRHSFATRCVECGFDIKTLSEILGHASVAITMNRYVHPSMESKQKSMDKLSELIRVNNLGKTI